MKNFEEPQSTRPPITIVVEGCVPSKKNRRILSHGKSFPPKEFILWQKAVKKSVLLQSKGKIEPFDSDGPCSVYIVFGMSDLRRRDVDNMVTSWLDALQEAGVLLDDSWTSVGCVQSILVYSPRPYSKAVVSVGNENVTGVIKTIKETKCLKKR
jgi:Holliday junction resolvase RusA-like endonuclease